MAEERAVIAVERSADAAVQTDHHGDRVSVILPTYNEAENIERVVASVRAILPEAEILVVDDDSPDRTWEIAMAIGSRDQRVRTIRRTSDRGLAAAVVEGFRASTGEVMVVMDADGQHDETKVTALVERVLDGADIAVGSRAVDGGGYGDWRPARRWASRAAAGLSRLAGGARVSDPMSGFFAVSRSYFNEVAPELNPRGFKILLELLNRGEPVVAEVGYHFRRRTAGKSKVGGAVIGAYLLALIDLRFGRMVSTRFVRYALVGGSGVVVNFSMFLVGRGIGLDQSPAVVFGIGISILWNFLLNNFWTFHDHAYQGRAMLRGAVVFGLVSCYGLVIQLAVFRLVLDATFVQDTFGERLGEVVANLIGIAFAVVANYFLNLNYTWRQRRGRAVRRVSSA